MAARVFAVLVLAVVATAAAVSAQGALFGGAFAVGDPYCIYCPDPNTLSEAGLGCHCPAGYTAFPAPPTVVGPWKLQSSAPLMRVASTCAVGGKQWHSSLSFCIAEAGALLEANNTRFEQPAASTTEQFAGFYQTVGDDCRISNPLTGSCSCPSDSEKIVIPHLSAESKSPVTFSSELLLTAGRDAELVICGRRAASAPYNFAGAFATANNGDDCVVSNPFSGACTCPAESAATTVSLVSAGGKPMTVSVCGPKLKKVQAVQICQGGEQADPSGLTDAAPAINRCIQRRSEVQLPSGVYLINSQIQAPSGGRIEAQNHQGNTCLMDSQICPVLRAGSLLTASGGMFMGRADMYNVVFDGNRLGRLGLISQCALNPAVGYNIFQRSAAGAGGFQMQGCAVVNAVCGAGLYSQIVGGLFSGAQIQSTLFRGNGGHDTATKSWANGLQIGSYSNGFQAQSNYYQDNSDSHVAIDEPTSGVEIEQSTYVMQSSQLFAGIRSSWPVNDTFLGPIPTQLAEPVPNWGNQYQQNTIQSNGLAYFGIQIGGRPWKANSPIVNMQQGLEVEENNLSGSAVLINIDAGVCTLQQNSYGAATGKFARCQQPTSQLNISPESRVNRQSESYPPPTSYTYAGCVP